VEDLVGSGAPAGWLVIGFFTPNYRPLAEAFAANLETHDIPFHLLARNRVPGQWAAQTLQKPAVVLDAFARYPGKTLILMDVDCEVRGDIAPITALPHDIALYWKRDHGPCSQPSSRVLVLKPTQAARAMVETWAGLCASARESEVRGDELLLAPALADVPTDMLPRRYSGACYYSSPDSFVIVHKSEHEKGRFWRPYLYRLKRARRRLVEQVIGMSYEDWKAVR
jgi:hypothetical protein